MLHRLDSFLPDFILSGNNQARVPPKKLNCSLLAILVFGITLTTSSHALDSALELRDIYANTVDLKLTLPADEQHYYAGLLTFQLNKAELGHLPAQYMLLVDRSKNVQAALLYWLADDGHVELIGASPVSTGKDNGYEYFETPVGIFEHTVNNPDFRAEGTKNKQGLMGYGNKGMRVYDFGWVSARKTWTPEMGEMRLQLHSTDPRLEARLGMAQSRGCIRIPATLNKLLNHYAVLDADYLLNQHKKNLLQLLDPAREITPWSGRYMLVVDSKRTARPAWTPLPAPRKKSG